MVIAFGSLAFILLNPALYFLVFTINTIKFHSKLSEALVKVKKKEKTSWPGMFLCSPYLTRVDGKHFETDDITIFNIFL